MRKLVAIAVLVALAACANDGNEGAAPEPSPTFTFPLATVLLDNGDESTLLTVDVAETPEQQATALDGRESLPDDEGVVYVFLQGRETGFETNETAIPLSIAYFDAAGTIVGTLDAEPCSQERCTTPDPGAPYMGALVVNQGMFEEWDISEGDHVQLTR